VKGAQRCGEDEQTVFVRGRTVCRTIRRKGEREIAQPQLAVPQQATRLPGLRSEDVRINLPLALRGTASLPDRGWSGGFAWLLFAD
jgi:hypothetical protein